MKRERERDWKWDLEIDGGKTVCTEQKERRGINGKLFPFLFVLLVLKKD